MALHHAPLLAGKTVQVSGYDACMLARTRSRATACVAPPVPVPATGRDVPARAPAEQRLRTWLLLAWLVCLMSATACAQTFEFESSRRPVASLDGKWRFHAGDDPRWAEPGFDDAAWQLLESDRPWYAQGYSGMSGWAWYRFAVKLPANAGPLSLQLPLISTAYELYADGTKIGACGNARPNAFIIDPHSCAFPLPPGDGSRSGTLHLALRVWHAPLWAAYVPGGPYRGGALIGDSRLIAETVRLQAVERASRTADLYVDAVLRGIIGGAILLLFLLRRREREFLWFALIQISGGADDVLGFVHHAFYALPVQLYDLLDVVFSGGFWLAGMCFVATILKSRRGVWFWLSLVCILCSPFAVPLYWRGWVSVPLAGALGSLMVLPSQVWALVQLTARARRRDPDAVLLLAPVFLVNALYVSGVLLFDLYQFGIVPELIDLFSMRFPAAPFNIGIYTLFNVAYSVALLGFLIRRLSRSRGREEQLEGQMEAARQVQQRLVPASNPAVPGFRIDAAYLPAAEVGGDFYQVMNLHDGSALILVGDVSGKGLKAAMNGVFAIGAARTLASEQLSPGRLLSRLNEEMIGSQESGFITCVCARIAQDGGVVIANAGHLAPYMSGEEVAIECGLPLGLMGDCAYAESRFTIAAGETLLFLSDGVVEARDAAGELFGFERTRAISGQPAEEIARVAQAFGQDDDITVLTVMREGSRLSAAPAE